MASPPPPASAPAENSEATIVSTPRKNIVPPGGVSGSCFCGAVCFSAPAGSEFAFRALCHCGICARSSGGIATAWVGFYEDTLRVFARETEGEIVPGDLLRGFDSSATMTRYCCAKCNGPVFNQAKDMPPGMRIFRDVPLVCFDREEDSDGNSGAIKHLDVLGPTCHIFFGKPAFPPSATAFQGDGLPKWASYPGVGEPLSADSGDSDGDSDKKKRARVA
jgi:hypothetical protein